MDDAFRRYAGFSLDAAQEPQQLAEHARRLGLFEPADHPFEQWPWDDLYELLLVQCIEPALPADKAVALMDYPAQVPCLAKDAPPAAKERWELYSAGVELANCYTEETDPAKVRRYFEAEGEAKQRTARVPHAVDPDYWQLFRDFPPCSGVALGVDRLVALCCGVTGIEGVLP
jgi:lysyl-tRNA synthetase class 2